jgi:predicted NBD/HSP70 family sugar kinase
LYDFSIFPKYIVLGGGMSTAGLILIENIKTEYHNLTFTPAQKDTEIVQAQLGNDTGITSIKISPAVDIPPPKTMYLGLLVTLKILHK